MDRQKLVELLAVIVVFVAMTVLFGTIIISIL